MQCLPYLQGIPPAYKVFFAGAREDYIRSRKRSPTPSCSSLQTKRPSSPARSSGSMAAKPPRDHSLRHACRLKPHRQRNSPMTQDSHQTAPTQFAEANGIRFAYRRFGNAAGVPLVFMQHFRGGMDHWDPTVTDGFAEHRPIILFDNAGVAASTGETPGHDRCDGRPRRRFHRRPRTCTNRSAGLLNRGIHRADPCAPPSPADPPSHTRRHQPARG
jgi:hypothetical protein